MEIKQAIEELRKNEKRKFEQSIDLIVNLKGVDLKRENVSAIVTLPYMIKEKKVAAFLTKKSDLLDTITPPEFASYKEKKEMKKLVKQYDFFIGAAPLMPSVATNFGKVLGPTGKMPSPQLGIVPADNDNAIKAALEKISKSIKLRAKEASVKVSVGNEKMKDEEIIANINAVYQGLVAALPTKRENVKSVMVKLTMSKPIRVEIK